MTDYQQPQTPNPAVVPDNPAPPPGQAAPAYPGQVPQGAPVYPAPAPAPGYPASVPPAAPMYPWAQPRVSVKHQTDPLEYHRLYRGINKYSWWKPLVMVLLTMVYYFVMSTALVIALILILVIAAPDFVNSLPVNGDIEEITAMLESSSEFQVGALLFLLLSVAIMWPAAILACLSVGIRPVGRLYSVNLKLRWRLLGKMTLLTLAVLVPLHGIVQGIVVALDPAATEQRLQDFNLGGFLLSMLIVLLIVPLQAGAEEVIFRGALLQMIGSWVKHPAVAIAITTVLFAAVHVQYDIWGITAVGLMGAAAGYLTWRTGGLETAIALHTVNNWFAFGVTLSGVQESAETSSGGPLLVFVELVVLSVFVAAAMFVFKRDEKRGAVKTTRVDTIEQFFPVDPAGRLIITPEQFAKLPANSSLRQQVVPPQPVPVGATYSGTPVSGVPAAVDPVGAAPIGVPADAPAPQYIAPAPAPQPSDSQQSNEQR